jgi:hypothetical protein
VSPDRHAAGALLPRGWCLPRLGLLKSADAVLRQVQHWFDKLSTGSGERPIPSRKCYWPEAP